MNDPYGQVAPLLKTIIEAEFATEGFTVVLDNLHDSLGRQRVDIGIAPEEESLQPGNDYVQETTLEVKFFDLWTQEIKPTTVVNPSRITNFAARFKHAVFTHQIGYSGTGAAWYFDVRRIRYTNDPTGNKTRFVATVRVKGINSALNETG